MPSHPDPAPPTTQQLAPRDAAFVYMEQPNTPVFIASIYVFDTATDDHGPMGADDVLEWMGARLDTAPVFRRRLVRAPFDLDRPYWVTDPDLDLRRHVFTDTLAEPGWDALRRRILDITDGPIDLSRPPWELHVITGVRAVPDFPEDATVVVLKVHHAACDGMASTEIARALFTDTPAPVQSVVAGRLPARSALFGKALVRLPGQVVDLARGIVRTISASRAVAKAAERGTLVLPKQLRPKTRFNTKISGPRVFDVVTLPLADIRAVKSRVPGATVNDVILTTVSIALSEYLNGRGEAPAESLAALVPMSARKFRDVDSANKFVPAFVDLHSDEEPRDRLAAISRSARLERERNEHDAVARANSMVQVVPGPLVKLLSRVSAWMVGRGPSVAYVNTMVSNVPRGPADLVLRGARVVTSCEVLALEDDDGLCHYVTSVGDTLTVSFVSTLEMLPDPEYYGELLRKAFDRLEAATAS